MKFFEFQYVFTSNATSKFESLWVYAAAGILEIKLKPLKHVKFLFFYLNSLIRKFVLGFFLQIAFLLDRKINRMFSLWYNFKYLNFYEFVYLSFFTISNTDKRNSALSRYFEESQ